MCKSQPLPMEFETGVSKSRRRESGWLGRGVRLATPSRLPFCTMLHADWWAFPWWALERGREVSVCIVEKGVGWPLALKFATCA